MYDDKLISISNPSMPAGKGHIHIAALESADQIDHDDFAHIASACHFSSMALFEGLGAHGTNIIITDMNDVQADVLVRMDNDDISFIWDAGNMPPHELDEVASKISDALEPQTTTQDRDQNQTTNNIPSAELKEEKEINDNKDNYLIKQLDRTP